MASTKNFLKEQGNIYCTHTVLQKSSKEKAEFSFFFFETMLPSNSFFPADVNYVTEKCLSTVKLAAKDIGKMIPNLDSNKTH